MDTNKQDYESAHSFASNRRLHRRFHSDFLRLTFLGVEQVAANWSEGGALIPDRHPGLEIGTPVIGIATIGPAARRFRFSAEVVRRGAAHIAIRFVAPSPALRRALSASSQ